MILFQKLSKKERPRNETECGGIISQMCKNGLLDGLVEDYIRACHSSRDDSIGDASRSKSKARTKFPNLAGFCRFMGTGISDVLALRSDFPEEHDKLLAVFEDEALNSEVSPTLLSAYLKKRMNYESVSQIRSESKEVRYCFDHDIFSDGE